MIPKLSQNQKSELKDLQKIKVVQIHKQTAIQQQQLYNSQCQSVCRSVCLPATILQKCYAIGSVYVLLLLLQDSLLDHSVVIFCTFSCDSSSIGRNVSRSVCQQRFYRSVMLLVVYICSQYYCSLDYQISLQSYFAILSAIAALQVAMSVGLSVFRNEFYGSVMLLLVHNCCYCCCSL